MLGHDGLIDRAGVVIQAPGDGQVDGEILLGHAEFAQVAGDGDQLVQALIEGPVHAPVIFQPGDHLGVRPADGHEVQHVFRLAGQHLHLVDQKLAHLFGTDFVQLVHGAHDLPGFLAHAVHGIKAVEDFAVVHPDLEFGDAQLGKGIVDDGGDLRLVDDIQLPVADDVDIRLIKFPETASLGPLAPVDLADLVAAEGEAQLAVMGGHIFCQGHSQIKAQSQVAVALGKAVDLFFGLAAALGQQHFGRFDDRRIQRRKAIYRIAAAQDLHHALHLHLLARQKLHKARQCAGAHLCHIDSFFLHWLIRRNGLNGAAKTAPFFSLRRFIFSGG